MVLKVILVLVVLLVAGGWLLFSGTLYKLTVNPAEQERGKAMHAHMRDLALHMQRDSLGVADSLAAGRPWGVIMDWGLGEVTTTVTAFASGDASIYISSGGGFIGGGHQPAIRAAALAFLSEASTAMAAYPVRTEFPLPSPGHCTFYLLTDAGVRVAEATERELLAPGHPLSRTGNAAQAIITAYRNTPGNQAMSRVGP